LKFVKLSCLIAT
jgi:hypothetical protein